MGARTVDYVAPQGSEHLIVAHDGQNVFDRKVATNRFTWRLAQQASRIFQEANLRPPTILAIFNSTSDLDPHGRALELTPERFFREGLKVTGKVPPGVTVDHLRGDAYLDDIFESILPIISERESLDIGFAHRALLGSSMGGLATLYEVGRNPDRYSAALAFSPHWVLGGEPLVTRTIQSLPSPGQHKVWMSRGTKKLDREYEPHQLLADRLMTANGWTRKNFMTKIYAGAGHNERAWAKQVSDALRFWLQG
jgi:predicted alpha/beta superfamily hydrolase